MAQNRLYEFKSVLLTAFIFLFVFSLMSGFKSQFLSTLAEKSSDNVSALINKGLALAHLGNYIQAIQYYDKALDIDPNNVDALYNKGNALDNLGNHTQAISYYNKVLDINPNDSDALNNKGDALAHLRLPITTKK
jgi:tetratricopeptide (TPR) repeat protein